MPSTENPIRKFRPAPFVPTASLTGEASGTIYRGENLFIRYSRFDNIPPYAEGYSGSADLSEAVPVKALTGSIAWTSSSTTITGTTTAFKSELHLGSFVFGDGGVGATELFVVELVVDDTHFIASRAPKNSGTGKNAYVLPVIQALGTQRATMYRGSVIQMLKGHILGVGDGEVKINGVSLNATFTLDRQPRMARFNPSTGLYTQDTVGITKPTTPFTLTAVTRLKITGVTAATPIVVTSVGHGLTTGDKVPIAQVVGVPEANGTFVVTVLTANTFSLDGTTGTGSYVVDTNPPGGAGAGGGWVFPSEMRAGGYNVRVTAKNTLTLGFSQPTDVIAPVTLTANQSIRIKWNTAMSSDQDAYDIYATPFEDNSTTTIEARYMGPWFLLNGTATSPNASVVASDLIDGSHATGRETGTSYVFSYSDAEIQASRLVLSFDNFTPVDAEFAGSINGFPIYYSCLGKGNTTKQSTSPGPAAVPSKPSNPEAVLLNQAFTTAEGDYIIGAYQRKARIFTLCQNSLQTVILTTIDEQPITFRSLWDSGFRNPYNGTFAKEYIYAFSTDGVVRSVAGGDDSTIEFEFTNDIRETVATWPCGHVLVGYDPKNRAVCFFYAAAERRAQSGVDYWVTIVLPFMLDKQVWNPPIVLSAPGQDFIVSGVAKVGNALEFVAGGRKSDGSVVSNTYRFDGGDSETKSWYLAWDYSDNDLEHFEKTVKGFSVTGRFANTTTVSLYGVREDGAFSTTLEAGTSPQQTTTFPTTSGSIKRKRFTMTDWAGFLIWSMRLSGSYTTTVDRLDELNVEYTSNAAKG